MNFSKSIVLLSGGLDSTTNLYQAMQDTKVQLALTFDYGQRAAAKEIAAAAYFSHKHQIRHEVLQIPWIKAWNKSSLINTSETVPTGQTVQIDALSTSQETAKSVWVPNRNGIFLNIAAGFAEALGADLVIPGFNLEEASTFPDNSEAFLQSLNQAFSYSTANQVKVKCFTIAQNKTEIVKRAQELGVEFNKLWFCYFGGESWCGECESCQRAKRAFAANSLQVNFSS